MTTYNIDYSDPLRTGFSIVPGGLDGPGGIESHTSLRLYGRGALEWGESVDENLVRLNENFAGATAPVVPIAGQLWVRQSLYVKNGASFFRWNISLEIWQPLTVVTVANSITAQLPGTSVGSYVYSTADAKLYRWDAAYKQKAASWLPRSLTVQATNPTSQLPVQDLLIYDEYTSTWVPPRATAIGAGLPASGDYDGQFYYDTDTGILYIWNARENEWQAILGPSNGGGSSPASGDIDMQNLYSVINMVTPLSTSLHHATTVEYVNTEIGNAISSMTSTNSGLYVTKTGGSTMNGTYTLTGTLNASATVSAATLTGTNATITNGTVTTLGSTTANIANLNVTTSASMGGVRILNVGYPSLGTDGANANYVNASSASTLASANATMRAEASLVNPGSYKNGDIYVNTGTGRAYIYLNGGFRQIWPATYS